jgi:hopene-associated glycosyltransferase HpnB
MMTQTLAAIALAVWLYLVFARGGFWRCRERDDWPSVRAADSPPAAIVVPARNEADQIGASIVSLVDQDYAGPFTVILVDDASTDGTADAARQSLPPRCKDRLRVVSGRALPMGWTGKLWAVKQGVDAAMTLSDRPQYLLLTDADIVHPPGSLTRLIMHAQANRLVLASLMVKLRCESFAERAFIPAFVFFFQMLYPFSLVNRADAAMAAAAGGCMLVRADALESAGGIDAIRGALIDDCALAGVLKRQGTIWLGLTTRVHSLRAYESVADIRRMVVRSAYAQLRYSPLLLLATVFAMAVTYLVPPVIALFGSGVGRAMAVAAWGLMALAFQPTSRLYGRSPLWGIALPAIALGYLVFTIDSAYQYARGRGGSWKGRVQGNIQAGSGDFDPSPGVMAVLVAAIRVCLFRKQAVDGRNNAARADGSELS